MIQQVIVTTQHLGQLSIASIEDKYIPSGIAFLAFIITRWNQFMDMEILNIKYCGLCNSLAIRGLYTAKTYSGFFTCKMITSVLSKSLSVGFTKVKQLIKTIRNYFIDGINSPLACFGSTRSVSE